MPGSGRSDCLEQMGGLATKVDLKPVAPTGCSEVNLSGSASTVEEIVLRSDEH
jgi:hypothetical protein